MVPDFTIYVLRQFMELSLILSHSHAFSFSFYLLASSVLDRTIEKGKKTEKRQRSQLLFGGKHLFNSLLLFTEMVKSGAFSLAL